jgi:hypothetical protein
MSSHPNIFIFTEAPATQNGNCVKYENISHSVKYQNWKPVSERGQGTKGCPGYNAQFRNVVMGAKKTFPIGNLF